MHMSLCNNRVTEKTHFFQISTDVHDNQTDYWESTDNLPKDARTFKENNCVYTDDPKNLNIL